MTDVLIQAAIEPHCESELTLQTAFAVFETKLTQWILPDELLIAHYSFFLYAKHLSVSLGIPTVHHKMP